MCTANCKYTHHPAQIGQGAACLRRSHLAWSTRGTPRHTCISTTQHSFACMNVHNKHCALPMASTPTIQHGSDQRLRVCVDLILCGRLAEHLVELVHLRARSASKGGRQGLSETEQTRGAIPNTKECSFTPIRCGTSSRSALSRTSGVGQVQECSSTPIRCGGSLEQHAIKCNVVAKVVHRRC